jgi:hypothetical protein
MTYRKPSITDVGSVHDLTLSGIYKTDGSGDVIYINNVPEPAPGATVTTVS